MWRARQQELTSPSDQRHDCRRDARVMRLAAIRADARPLVYFRLGRRAAVAAELVGPVPVDDLECAPRQREQRIVERTEKRTQSRQLHARRQRGVLLQFAGEAMLLPEDAEVLAALRRESEFAWIGGRRDARALRATHDQDLRTVEREPQSRSLPIGRRTDQRGKPIGSSQDHYKCPVPLIRG